MSIDHHGRIKCDDCGRFIGIQDLIDETAKHRLLTPDSHFSREEYESTCTKCVKLKR